MNFSVHQLSHIGNRKYNQDRVAYAYTQHALLLVLADGMGGHTHGELAAETAIETFINAFEDHGPAVFQDPLDFLSRTMECAHRRILQLPRANNAAIPGTTCVAALVQNNQLYFGHAGDSRLYLFRQQQLLCKTSDHSLVAMWVEQGVLSERDALRHPLRNQITNCLGGGENEFHMEAGRVFNLQADDVVLMGSDGLWAQFGDQELARRLAAPLSVEPLQQLTELALDRADGHADNISGLTLYWSSQAPELLPEQVVVNILYIP